MQHRTLRNLRGLFALLLLPLYAAGCARATEDLEVTPAPAPGQVVSSQSGALTVLDMTFDELAAATEAAFTDLGIVFEEREAEDDGIEYEGRDNGQIVLVDIERDADEVLTEIEVSVTRDRVTWDRPRAGQILRAIVARAR